MKDVGEAASGNHRHGRLESLMPATVGLTDRTDASTMLFPGLVRWNGIGQRLTAERHSSQMYSNGLAWLLLALVWGLLCSTILAFLPSRNPKAAIVGACIGGLVVAGVGYLYTSGYIFPATVPVTVSNVRADFTPEGLWRITADRSIRVRCEKLIVVRQFVVAGDGIKQIDPVTANVSSGENPEAVQEIDNQLGDYPDRWLEFEPIAGISGTFRVVLYPTNCANGWTGAHEILSKPFYWTDLPARVAPRGAD